MNKITPEFAEILGLLCAEGCHNISYSSYWSKDRGKPRFFKNDKSEKIEFYNKDLKLLYHYKNLLAKEFDYHPKITKHGKILICTMSIIKRIVSETELGHLKWSVPKSVFESDEEVKIKFLRGFFDGDGTASRTIRFFSTNLSGILQISELLNQINILNTFRGPIFKEGRKPYYVITIPAKQRERFLNVIQPISKRPGI